MDPTAADVARRAGTSFVALVLGLDLRLRTDLLVPLSRWVTPVGLSRRYDARFFVAWLPPGAAVDHDRREVVDHAWLRPAEALAAMASGRIGLWPPTSTTLQQLAAVHEARDVVDHLAPRAPAAAPVTDVVAPDVVRIRLGGAAGIPGNRVNAYLVGRRRVVVVDPGDPNDASVDAIFAAAEARGAGITAVLLTGPVPDHAAGATSVAARAGVPVLAAPGAAAVLPGPFEPLGEGRAPDLSDTLIRVLGTPGPHPDHLAFDLPDAGAVLTGDLDGGPLRGTAGRADEWERSRSAARIDALGPRTRLPAHGGEDR